MPQITCPGCRRSYAVPEAALGRRVRCKKCGEAFLIAVPEDEELYELAADEGEGTGAASQVRGGPAASGVGGTALGVLPPVAGSMVDPTRATFRDDVPPSGGLVGLIRDTGWSFLWFTDVGAIVTFIFLAIAMVFYIAVGYFFVAGQLIITAWYYAYLLQVIEDAAAGERGLPSMQPEGGLFALVVPLLKFLAVQLVSHLPFLVLLTYLSATGTLPVDEIIGTLEALSVGDYQTAFAGFTPGAAAAIAGLMGTLLFATLMQPMLFLCLAIGGPFELFRIDLMLQTIIRTALAYGFVLLVFVALSWLPSVIGMLTQPETAPGQWSGIELLHEAAILWLTVYCDLVAMRVAGLYYHHCKDRFAWTWG